MQLALDLIPVPLAELFPFPTEVEAGGVFCGDGKTGVSGLEGSRYR